MNTPGEHAGQGASMHPQGAGGIVERGDRRLHCARRSERFEQRGAHESGIATRRASSEWAVVDDCHLGAALGQKQ